MTRAVLPELAFHPEPFPPGQLHEEGSSSRSHPLLQNEEDQVSKPDVVRCGGHRGARLPGPLLPRTQVGCLQWIHGSRRSGSACASSGVSYIRALMSSQQQTLQPGAASWVPPWWQLPAEGISSSDQFLCPRWSSWQRANLACVFTCSVSAASQNTLGKKVGTRYWLRAMSYF